LMINKTFALLIALFTFFIIFLFYLRSTKVSQKLVSINTTHFDALIADTEDKRSKGLSILTDLPDNRGMLFVFDSDNVYATFWMKDMKFSIDILWIDDNKIVKIDKAIPAPVAGTQDNRLTLYSGGQSIDYVFEVKAGVSDKFGFEVGDSFTFGK